MTFAQSGTNAIDCTGKDKLASKHNSNNIQALSDAQIHNWYRFVLAFPDHLVASLLKEFKAQQGHVVLDPFAGTGTTLVECKKRGIDSIGIDANPFTVFASRVKTTWNIDIIEFERRMKTILKVAQKLDEDMAKQTRQLSFDDFIINQSCEPMPDIFDDDLASRTDTVFSLLPANWIDHALLKKTLAIKKIIDDYSDDATTALLHLALMSVIVNDVSNIGFGPEVYVARKRTKVAFYEILFQKLSQIKDDLLYTQTIQQPGKAIIHHGDARNLCKYVQSPVHFVISSPPYPNEKDYTRITRLEMVLLGYMQNKQDLRQIKEAMLRSHTRNLFVNDHDATCVNDIPEIQELAYEIERRRQAKGATSGFEKLYHRVVTEYFGGMYRVLKEINEVLISGGKIAFVVGDQMSYFRVPIYTAQLLQIVASRKLGYKTLEKRVYRTRQATATRAKIEEHILILEKP